MDYNSDYKVCLSNCFMRALGYCPRFTEAVCNKRSFQQTRRQEYYRVTLLLEAPFWGPRLCQETGAGGFKGSAVATRR